MKGALDIIRRPCCTTRQTDVCLLIMCVNNLTADGLKISKGGSLAISNCVLLIVKTFCPDQGSFYKGGSCLVPKETTMLRQLVRKIFIFIKIFIYIYI